jgi:hypothetical protein
LIDKYEYDIYGKDEFEKLFIISKNQELKNYPRLVYRIKK